MSLLPGKENSPPDLFEETLFDPIKRKQFGEFLQKEHNQENLLFWEECNHLHSLSDQTQIDPMVQSIYTRYIPVNASFALNLSHHIRERIQSQVHAGPPF